VSPTLQDKPKAILTGIDQLITDAHSWFELSAELGVDQAKHRHIYEQMRNGKIVWTDAKYEIFDVLKSKTKKVHREVFERSIGTIELDNEAVDTINELKARGYRVGIISGSIDMIVGTIARWLKIEDWYANATLSFDQDGYWSDIEFDQNEAGLKLSQAKNFLAKHNLKPEECLVLGHSSIDIEMFKLLPGVALKSKNEELKNLAWKQINQFPQILQVLQQFE
jgi:HAD superfamily phosphoserine phosphatase-like hydrolase